MVIIEAGEARLFVKLNDMSLIKENLDFVLAKEEVWHQIKRACIMGKYKVVAEVKDEAVAKDVKAVFDGYGYDVVVEGRKLYVDWGTKDV